MRTRRAGLGFLAAMGGAAMFLAAPMAGASPSQPAPGTTAAADAVSKITVTQTALAPVLTCAPAEQALTYTTFSDGSVFRLRVRASSPLCSPITATAAIYAMPGDGSVWPQTLAETKNFTISGASQTDIVFTKDCTPAQFDVVVGATPQVISPLGERHGPLLIPDVNTAYQDPGVACTPTQPSSTTIPDVVVTVPEVTSTTVATTSVTNTTIAPIVGGVSVTTPTDPPRVLDTTSNRSTSAPSSLAVTGVSSQGMGMAGLALFVVGLALLVTARLRALPAVRMITSSWSVDPNSPFSLD